MTVLDQLRLGGELNERMQNLLILCDYNPEKIGTMILEACGYKVTKYLKGGIAVEDKNKKLLYYDD